MDSDERVGLGIPVILLGAVWGAFGLVLEVFTLLNERRDTILKMKSNVSPDIGWNNLIWSDWIWLWVGTIAFLTTVTGVILYIPQFFSENADASLKKKTSRICYAVALLPAFSAIGFLVGGIFDLVVML